MSDLDTQLRDYLVSVSPPPFELEEIAERAAGVTPSALLESEVALRPRRRWVTALAAGVATLVVIGGVALLIQRANLPEDPVSTPVTSVIDPAPTTTVDVAPTTTAPRDAASTAAMTWTRIAEPAVFGGDGWQRTTDIAVGGDIAVAVGYDASGGDDDAAVWYSLDGATWSRVPHDEAVFGGAGHQQIRGVTALESGFVAVGYEGDFSQHEGDTSPLNAFGGSEAHAAVWHSDDGVSWMRVPHAEAVFGADEIMWMNDVTFGDSKLIAVGTTHQRVEQLAAARYGPLGGEPNPPMSIDIDADAAVWTSVDGLAWSRVDAGDEVFGGDTVWQRMYAVTPGGPGFVAVGQEGFDYLYVDEWTPIPGNNTEGVEHVMDNVAAVWTSPDGTTWTRVADESALAHSGENVTGWATMFDVTATESGLVAVGRDVWDTVSGGGFNEGAAVWLSDDGMSWRRVAHGVYTGRSDMAAVIATNGDDLVAAGGMLLYVTAGAWTSPDGGNTWIEHPYEDTLFGAKPGSRSDAGSPASIQGLAMFDESVIGVGTFDTDAAVWIGTWTDTGG